MTMQVDDLPAVDPHVDYTQILPIQQKRTIAFINHFVMNTVSFLNTFAQSCESRLMEFEYKIQKIEAALLILEAQLSSISGLSDIENNNIVSKPTHSDDSVADGKTESAANATVDVSKVINHNTEEKNDSIASPNNDSIASPKNDSVRYCEDPRYSKFFKMVQVGVPQQAVKLKMESEGIDSSILDTPNTTVEASNDQSIHSESPSGASTAS